MDALPPSPGAAGGSVSFLSYLVLGTLDVLCSQPAVGLPNSEAPRAISQSVGESVLASLALPERMLPLGVAPSVC
jgi:hypothetical protein